MCDGGMSMCVRVWLTIGIARGMRMLVVLVVDVAVLVL